MTDCGARQSCGLLRDGDRVVGVRASNAEGELDLHGDLVVGADGRASAAATSGRRVATCQRRASAEGQPSLCSERKGISSVGRKGSGRLGPFVFTNPPPT